MSIVSLLINTFLYITILVTSNPYISTITLSPSLAVSHKKTKLYLHNPILYNSAMAGCFFNDTVGYISTLCKISTQDPLHLQPE